MAQRQRAHLQTLSGIIAVVLGATPIASQAQWVAVTKAQNDDFVIYAHPATKQWTGNTVKVWELKDYRSAQPMSSGLTYRSSKAQMEYDCTGARRRFLALSFHSDHMGLGRVQAAYQDFSQWRSSALAPNKWAPVSPGSVDYALWKFACLER